MTEGDEAVAECTKRVGDIDALQNAIKGGRATLEDIKHSVEVASANQRLSADAVSFLSATPETTVCPVCGQAVTGRQSLTRLREPRRPAQSPASRSGGSAQDDQLRDHDRRRGPPGVGGQKAGRRDATRQLETARQGALALLGTPVEPAVIVATLDARAIELQAAAARAQEVRAAAEEDLGAADGLIERLRVVYRWFAE